MSRVPRLKVISGLGKPVFIQWRITEVPLSRQGGLAGRLRAVTSTEPAKEKTKICQLTLDCKLYIALQEPAYVVV